MKTFSGCEEVYGRGYDTAGNYHWFGTETGEHCIPKTNNNCPICGAPIHGFVCEECGYMIQYGFKTLIS